MSISKEINDFTDGFTQGYKIWSDIETRKETKDYHEKLEAHWLAESNARGNKGDIPAAITTMADDRAGKIKSDLGGGTTGDGGNKPQLTPDILNDPDKMRDFIHQAESKNNYNATVYMANGKAGPTANLTDMTLEQVQAYQKDMIANGHASTALGAGQYKASTLNGLINTLGLDRKTTLFSKDTQDKLTDELLRQRGYDDFKNGKMDSTRFLTNLSYEWAALPNPHTGVSTWKGTAGNAATVGYGSGIFSTTPEPLPGAAPKAAERTRYVGDPIVKPAATTPAPAPASVTAQPTGTSAPAAVLPVPPPTKPSMATPPDATSTPRTSDLGATQNPIPVPASMMADAPGAAAIPSQTSPVQLASAVSPWAIPGYPNPMAQFAGGGLVTPQPTQGPRYDSGSQVAESAIPPNALNVYQAGGNVMPQQLQASVQDSLPHYDMGGEVEPEAENTEGDTSPIPGFDPNTPVDVRGYDGLFTAAQAQAAKDSDDSTPGIDEYWAAARRQQASRPPGQAPQTPAQDPQLAASRPPGQAIPVTGSTAPGDTGQPTSFFDFIGKAIGGIADVVHGGLMGLARMLGLSSAIPTGGPVDPAVTQKIASGDGIKYSPEEIKAVDKAVGIPDTLTPALKNLARLSAGYDYYKSRGDMVSANKWAGSMLATIADSVRMDGTMALLAGKHGDVAMMAQKLKDAHDKFPDGNIMKIGEVSKAGASFEIIGPDGKVSQSGQATIDDMMKLATNTANGTEFFKQAGYLGGKSTPQQIAQQRDADAVEAYQHSPGPMTDMEAKWRASKSPEQLRAIDAMHWKTKQELMQKEVGEKKVTDEQQNNQEASRLLGLEQEAMSELQAAQQQRTNPLQPTTLEIAAQNKLDGVRKAIHAWGEAEPGRWQYLRALGGGVTSSGKSTGVGVTTPGAIPTPGEKLTPTEQAQRRENTAQLVKDQAERVATLGQEQFSDEGKPLGETRAKTRAAYQQVLQGQAVQRKYEEAGADKGPRKAELDKITGELDEQSPDLADPKYAGLKQRFSKAASVFMNNNDVTAKQAVSIVKSITELDPDGKPKAEMSFTDDGRVKVGGYSPMIIDRETLGLLGNLTVEHAKAKPTKPELNVVPRDPAQDEQDLQAAQAATGLRPGTLGIPGPSHGLFGSPTPVQPPPTSGGLSPDERDEQSAASPLRRYGAPTAPYPSPMSPDARDERGRVAPFAARAAPPAAAPAAPYPSPAAPYPSAMSPDERDERGRVAPAAIPVAAGPGRRRSYGSPTAPYPSPTSPDERGERGLVAPPAGARPGRLRSYGSPTAAYPSPTSPDERDETRVAAERKGAIDAATAAAPANKLRAAVEDFIQNPGDYRKAKSKVQQLLDEQEQERVTGKYWREQKSKQNAAATGDVSTKKSMRDWAEKRAVAAAQQVRARRTAIPTSGP